MDLFNCSVNELAKEFARNEKIYENFSSILTNLETKLNPKINLENTIEKINKAKNICSEGRYFLFSIDDSWAQFHKGFELYKLVAGKMIPKIKTDQEVRQADYIVDYLKKNKIKTIYNPTYEIAGKYTGAEGYDCDDDGDHYHIKELSQFDDLNEFFKEGIKIIGVDFEDESL